MKIVNEAISNKKLFIKGIFCHWCYLHLSEERPEIRLLFAGYPSPHISRFATLLNKPEHREES